MKNKWLWLLILIIPLKVMGLELPELNSTHILLYDPETSEVLYEKGSDEVINIASLTKIVTTITAIQNIKDLNATVTYTEEMQKEVPSDASVAGLKVGDTLSYLDLLYASILPSGADATTALAYGISGSSASFIDLMNDLAKDLNLENTHFVNVTGYDANGHYSTPKEVLQILLYALKNDLFKTIYKTREYTLSNGLHVESTILLYNKNNTYDLSNILGSKTGFTSLAGVCMSSIIKVKDKELILLTFGAPRSYVNPYHIIDANTVIDYLNANYENRVVLQKGEYLLSIPVSNSTVKEYKITVPKDFEVYAKNDDEVTYTYEGLDNISYKIKKGSKLGTITYKIDDRTFTENVYLEHTIFPSLGKFLHSNPIYLVPFVIVLLLSIVAILLKKKKRKKKHRKK